MIGQLITTSSIQDILLGLTGRTFDLPDGYFIRFPLAKSEFISYSSHPMNDRSQPSGIVILEFSASSWRLLPSILDLLDLPHYQLESLDMISKLTHGEDLSVKIPDGVYIVVDNRSRSMALVKVRSSVLYPLTDIGGYLRWES